MESNADGRTARSFVGAKVKIRIEVEMEVCMKKTMLVLERGERERFGPYLSAALEGAGGVGENQMRGMCSKRHVVENQLSTLPN